jgi:predicted esterase
MNSPSKIEREKAVQKISHGIEKVIWLAALEGDFQRRMFADRGAALDACEVELTGSERKILLSIPDVQLKTAVERADVPAPARRTFLKGAAAGAFAILGGVLANPSCINSQGSAGIQPDRPGDSWQNFADHSCHVHVPKNYAPSTPTPAIIFFHGTGEDSNVSLPLWRAASDAGGFIICCPDWTGDAADVAAEAADASVIRSDMAAVFNVKADQVYLGGFAGGGEIALLSALSLDGSWAGVISWAALVPDGIDPANAPRKDMAIHLATGDGDTQVTPGAIADLAGSLEVLGFTVHTETASGGHASNIYDASAAWAWISGFANP